MAGRLFAIGDIHGCAGELEALVAGLAPEPGDTLLFVGDYIDRGPDSRGVIDLVMELATRSGLTTVCLRGNHEDMCLAYLGRGGRYAEAWMVNGGAATMRSYGLDARTAGSEAALSFPLKHLQFLERLPLWHRTDGFLVVHAGIRPDLPWDQQQEEDLLWIREDFILSPHALPETIVFGHTPRRTVFVHLPYKIGIDTGCVYGGALTALELREKRLFQVRLGERKVRESALPVEQRRRA